MSNDHDSNNAGPMAPILAIPNEQMEDAGLSELAKLMLAVVLVLGFIFGSASLLTQGRPEPTSPADICENIGTDADPFWYCAP